MATVRWWREELESAAWKLYNLLDDAETAVYDKLNSIVPPGGDDTEEVRMWEETVMDRISEALSKVEDIANDMGELGYDNGSEVLGPEVVD